MTVALLALLTAMLGPVAAEQPVPDHAAANGLSGGVRYRRVFVPEDQIEQWPRHGVRYLPMNAAEFERMAGSLVPAARTPVVPSDEVTRAVYEARLVGDALSDGQATLQIRHADKGPAFFQLDPCRLPIQSPRWLAETPPAETERAANSTTAAAPVAAGLVATAPVAVARAAVAIAPRPAMLGVGADGKPVLRVERSGTLQFDWSLVGHRETGAALVFDLQLPPASSNELRLALPPDLVPTVEQGFVTLVAPNKADGKASSSGGAADSANAATSAANKNPLQQWDIELGGQSRIVVRLARHDFLRESRPLTLMRQSLVYDFSPRGMQLSAELKLDVLGEPIHRIALLVDQPLALVTARYGGAQLPWFETDSTGKSIAASDLANPAEVDRSGVHRVVLELPEPLHGTGRVLRLGFVAPFIARGRLPALRPADDGLFWQEGSASLLVPLPLELNELTLRGCRQTKTEPLTAPSVGDAISLQYFRPDADVDIALARRGQRLQAQSGTMIDVRGGTMTGRCLVDVTAQEGECFELSADVSPSWIIDSVESVPANSVADWRYKAGNGPAAQLDISLAKSIRPDRPLRLIVSGRWRRAPRGERLRPDDLQLVTLRGATTTRGIAAIRPATPYRSQTTGAEELHRLDPAHLAAADAALLGGAPIAEGTLVFVDDEAAEGLTLTVATETPRFSGAVHLDAQVADSTLVESYRLRCKPESAELDRLLVHFSRRRDEPIRWNLVTPEIVGTADAASLTAGSFASTPDLQDQLSARRLSAVQQAALGLATGGEVWELTFRNPGSKPLEIQAMRNSALTAETPLSLAELVQASEQQGSVVIRATGRRVPQINNRRLKPVPIDPAATDSPPKATDSAPRGATELAAYQYDPAEEIISAAADPAPSITVSPGTERPAAWAWSCRLDSYFSPDGSSQHLACWQIENTGRTRVRIQMPAGATFHSAWVDDALRTAGTLSTDTEPSAAASAGPTAANGNHAKVGRLRAANNASIKLELPAERRFVRVVLEWGSDDGPLSLLSSRTAQLPEIDMPVMARQWHVWLPPRFRLSNPDADRQSSFAAPINWSQRLFGPFGKPAGETAFNPLRSDEWVAMARPFSNHDPAWAQASRIVERLEQRAKSGTPALGAVRSGSGKNETAAAGDLPATAAATTWGELLAGIQSEFAQTPDARPLPLLVDTEALADIGLSPRTPVRFPSPEAAIHSPLMQADFVLLVDPRGIILTSRSAAAVWAGPRLSAESVLERTPPGPLDEALQRALAGASARFIPVESWNFPDSKSPWSNVALAGNSPRIDHVGWAVYDLDLSDGSRRIGIVDRDMMLVVGCGLFLLTALLVFAKGDVSWKHQGIALCCATAIALLLPASCAPLGAGLWLGLAVGWTLRWLARWDRPLGAYSRRLIAAATGGGAAARASGDLPTGAPTSDSGDTTFLSPPLEPAQPSSHGASKTSGGSPAPSSGSSSIGKRGGRAGPTLGLLLALGCLVWQHAGAAEPQTGSAQSGSAQTSTAQTEHAKPQASRSAVNEGGAVGEGGADGGGAAIPDVLIPTDDQQHRKGKVYLVPEGLYRELFRRADRSPPPAPLNWLITGAKYQGGLIRQANAAALDSTNWSATYDLEVLSPPAPIWIPLGDSSTNLLPDGVRLDGIPIQFQWEVRQGAGGTERERKKSDDVVANGEAQAPAEQRGVAFDVGATGHHRVELAFRPTPHEQAGATTLELAILPLATSRLELSVPADVPVEVPGARGQLSFDRAHGRLTESLGPIDRLTVRGWSDPAGGEVKPPVVDVDELYWLKVQPGSVVLEARFDVRVREGKLTQLQLLEDPRLRRLPLEAGSPISEVRTEQGDLHTIYVGLAQPIVDRTSFKLSFLLTDTSGIGNLRLPRLEVLGVREQNRKLAISVEPPLEFDVPATGPVALPTPAALNASATGKLGPAAAGAPLTPTQFLAAWGAADAKPQLAYKLPPGDITWNLPIHYRKPEIESSEQLVVAVERGRLHETWLADLTVRGGTVFEVQVPAPSQWVVAEALLRQEGSPDQTVRWARAPDGDLTLFLSAPAPEHSQLLLRGSMPYAAGKATALPELRVRGPSAVKVASQSMLVLRGADVQVAVAEPAGMQQSAAGGLQSAVDQALADGLLDHFALGHLRPAVALSGHAAAGASPAIRITANAPLVDGREMTTVRRIDEAWNAAIDLDLEISGGVLDGLRFDLPPQWTDLTEITPATPSRLIDVPGENRRQLVLRPDEPWTGTVRLHLSGPINTPSGQRVRVPDVRLLGVSKLRRYVLLPTRSGDQNLSWEASGLNFEPLPERFSPESSRLELYRTCEVVADHFEATLKSVDKTIGQPRVRLADIAVACSESGHCHGAATFDLEPAGALNCFLELSPNERLIHVRADGLAAAARPVGENHWSIAFGDGKLPQRIEVVFTADVPSESAGGGRLLLSAPVLVDLPVEETLWSVTAASASNSVDSSAIAGSKFGRSMAVVGAAPATAVRQDLVRLETISQLLESVASAPAAGPDDQIAGWFAPWTHRLRIARGALDRSRAREGSTEAGRAADQEIQKIDARQSKLTHRFGIGGLTTDSSARRPVADDALDIWSHSDGSAQPVVGFYVHGFGPTLALAPPRRGLGETAWRLIAAILGTAAVGALFWLTGTNGPWHSLILSPAILGVAAGLFWWLEMEPSWLGLAIVAASLIAFVRSRWIARKGLHASNA